MERLMSIADRYRIRVIEDATEALGSKICLRNGESAFAGTLGHFGSYSFNGNKVITTGGEGMLVAKEQSRTREARYLSTQAKDDEVFFVHNAVGYNYRLNSLQAALGIAQLERIPEFIREKRRIFETYQDLLSPHQIGSLIEEPESMMSNLWLATLVLNRKADLKKIVHLMAQARIQIRPVWKLNHEQLPYRDCQTFEITQAPELCSGSLTSSLAVRISVLTKSAGSWPLS